MTFVLIEVNGFVKITKQVPKELLLCFVLVLYVIQQWRHSEF